MAGLRASAHVAEFLYDEEEMSLSAGLERDETPSANHGTPAMDDYGPELSEADLARVEMSLLRSQHPARGAGGVPCVHCGSDVTGSFIEAFSIAACHSCRAAMSTQYKLVTRTYCKAELLLTDKQLDRLNTLRVPNPHKKSFPPMRLYLRSQAESIAMATWGSEADIEAERRRREDVKLVKATDKAKKAKPLLPVSAGRARAAGGAALGAQGGDAKRARTGGAAAGHVAGGGHASKAHEHVFDGSEECVDAANDIYARTCTICKCVCTYEKM